jgi:phosphoribosylanthranilate isomerase
MDTLIKFCGFTNFEDAKEAVRLGVNYLGFILEVPTSKRSINQHTFYQIVRELRENHPGDYQIVVVTQNQDKFKLSQIVDMGLADILQFHGQERPELLSEFYFNVETWKVFEVTSATDFEKLHIKMAEYKNVARRFLLDLPKNSEEKEFSNLSLYKKATNMGYSLALAGGLNKDSIEIYLQELEPEIIDITSSIELEPGKKDHQKMLEFMQTVRNFKPRISYDRFGL